MTSRIAGDFALSGGREDARRTALVIIDFTDWYTRDALEAPRTQIDHDYHVASEGIRALTASLREACPSMPQVWVADMTVHPLGRGMDPDAGNRVGAAREALRAAMSTLSRDDITGEFTAAAPAPGDPLFLKTGSDLFAHGWRHGSGETFANYLSENGIGRLLLCGTTIPDCILATAIGGTPHGVQSACVLGCSAGGTSIHDRRELSALCDEGLVFRSGEDVLREFRAPMDAYRAAIGAAEASRPPVTPGRLRSALNALLRFGA